MTRIRFMELALAVSLAAWIGPAILNAAAPPADQSVVIYKDVPVEYDKDLPEGTVRKDVTYLRSGQVIEATIDLPMPARDQRDARRIVATITVKPIMTGSAERQRPGDPWTRVGSVRVLRNSEDASSKTAASQPETDDRPASGPKPSKPPLPPATTEPEVPRAADEIEL